MFLDLSKVQNILLEFLEAKVIPVAPPLVKFLIGGAIPVTLGKIDVLLKQYEPLLKTLEIIKDNKLDIAKASSFIRGGFDKTGSVTIYNFTFNREDGEYLIGLMEKYKDA